MNKSLLSKGAAVVVIACLLLLAMACSPAPAAPAPTDTPAPTGTAAPADTPAPTPDPDSTATADPGSTSAGGGGDAGAAAGLATSVAARTPIPSPTPDRIESSVDELADRAGLGGFSFLGLTPSDWADLLFSVLIVVAGYFLARFLVKRVLKWFVRRTPTKLDNEFLNKTDRRLLWLVVLIIANYAVTRLSFLGESLREAINDIFFLLGLVLVTSLVLESLKFIAAQYKAKLATPADQERLDPVITATRRFAGATVLVIAVSITLSHFGVDLNTLYLVLIIFGVIISMAGNAIVSDALSGFIILIDQPYRVGDSIQIEELNTWGDVLEIGTRTTRIVTKDNRELIVPNSQMAKSPIVNYTYPDTKYRVQTDFELAYGIDIDQIRKTATDAVRSVKEVLDDEPVNVYFMAFDGSHRKMRVRWWIASFHNEYPVLDEVNVALEEAFEQAHIDLPSGTTDVLIKTEDGDGQTSGPQQEAAQEKDQDEHTGH